MGKRSASVIFFFVRGRKLEREILTQFSCPSGKIFPLELFKVPKFSFKWESVVRVWDLEPLISLFEFLSLGQIGAFILPPPPKIDARRSPINAQAKKRRKWVGGCPSLGAEERGREREKGPF